MTKHHFRDGQSEYKIRAVSLNIMTFLCSLPPWFNQHIVWVLNPDPSPDRVLEDRHITSSGARSRLLTIPVEILANILKHIAEDKKALASLALVTSDCRKLARSYQFSTLCFDYGPNTLDLLARLVEEKRERLQPWCNANPFHRCLHSANTG